MPVSSFTRWFVMMNFVQMFLSQTQNMLRKPRKMKHAIKFIQPANVPNIQRIVLGFNEAGELDSYEFRCAASGHEAAQAIHDQAERQWIDGRGQAPTTAYYLTGSPGYRAEVAGWPTDGRPVMGPDKGQPYIVPVLIKNDRKGGAS